MYEDRIQNYDPEIHEEYLVSHTGYTLPPATSFPAICRLQTIAQTQLTETQHFSAVTVSLKSGFLKFFSKKLNNLKFALFRFFVFFCKKKPRFFITPFDSPCSRPAPTYYY